MERLVPYGIMNYAELMLKKTYFIDKTEYIGKIESIANPVFLRPRRFGKSLFCSMFRCYYYLLPLPLNTPILSEGAISNLSESIVKNFPGDAG